MKDKLITNFLSNITFEDVTDDDDDINESISSLNLNKNFVSWIKFIFTDSEPNANRQRIPEEEFDNIISTGLHMPIKAASLSKNGIPNGHEGAYPIGVITNLKKVGGQIKGLAALWKKEREEDVNYIKEAHSKGIPINLSWELGYVNSSVDDNGIEDLHDVVVRATTIVGMPAYKGRTPVLEISASEQNKNVEDTELEELELLKQRVSDLENKMLEKDTALSAKDDEIKSLREENENLLQFKAEVEAKEEKERKLKKMKEKCKEAGIIKDDQYFIDNAEKLLSMTEESFEFMLQEMVAFSSAYRKESTSSLDKNIPNLNGNSDDISKDPKALAQALRELKSK
jgi:hypothetical protein